MARRDDEKIKAHVIADLTAGDQPAVVAERYGIPASKVRTWKVRYVAENVAPVAPTAPPVQLERVRQQNRIGEIVLELLATKLEASQAIAQQANDVAWRKQQRAGELATFGQWLDQSALALGDRLAGASRATDDESGE